MEENRAFGDDAAANGFVRARTQNVAERTENGDGDVGGQGIFEERIGKV